MDDGLQVNSIPSSSVDGTVSVDGGDAASAVLTSTTDPLSLEMRLVFGLVMDCSVGLPVYTWTVELGLELDVELELEVELVEDVSRKVVGASTANRCCCSLELLYLVELEVLILVVWALELLLIA